jgi:predicted phage-related endonuclease
MARDHELSRTGITSTDIPKLVGEDPYGDAHSVYLEKTGQSVRFPPTPRMIRGKIFERGIAELYSIQTGDLPVWRDETVRHPKVAWALGTPDAVIEGTKKLLECKLVAYDQRHKWESGVPVWIVLQIWWLLFVLNFDEAVVAAMIGDDLPRIYTIPRDREAEQFLVARASDFWHNYVLRGIEPPLGASLQTSEWLKQTFRNHGPEVRPAGESEIALLEEYAELRSELKPLEKRREVLEAKLKKAVGEDAGLSWPAGRFTWRKTKDTEETHWEALALELLARHSDAEDAAAVIRQFTSPVPGIRRIRFESAKGVADAA